MSTFTESVKKLCDASVKSYLNPYSYIEWPEQVDLNQWFISPELISIYGTPVYEGLDDETRRNLSFYEAVNFFSLNIHGEKNLVEGLAHRLYSKSFCEFSEYLHHFLDEENKHMIYFGGFCRRYAGKIYRDRKLAVAREYAPGEEDFLFFARVMIFEEIVDAYNVRVAGDERVEKTARQINKIHHLEEARHLVFGRQIVQYLFEKHSPSWDTATRAALQSYLAHYIASSWKEYYNPDVYKDAFKSGATGSAVVPGKSEQVNHGEAIDPYDLVDKSWQDPACRQHRISMSSKVVQFLKEHGMIVEEPSL